MDLMLGGLNGNYLRNITLAAKNITEEVLAAVAYATDGDLLFEWCWENSIPLKFYGRLDDQVAVAVPILQRFLGRKSQNFVCKLVPSHHAKVIWWKGYGLYVGSANLTRSAWYNNVEAGCFFAEHEIDDAMSLDLHEMFATLEMHSTPLTAELLELMRSRSEALRRGTPSADQFWKHNSIRHWKGVANQTPVAANEQKREAFLREWYSTLEILRVIGEKVSEQRYRPTWVSADAPSGAQADQFLHAHYYQRTFDGRRADYETYFERNMHRVDDAVGEAMSWWSKLPGAPGEEDKMLNDRAPRVRSLLSYSALANMTLEDLTNICLRVNATIEYARRVPNTKVNLVADGRAYTIPEKVEALSKVIWTTKTAAGYGVSEVLQFLLYGGRADELPERLWTVVSDPKWKIRGLGISALGEIVGWGLPDRFPPRNGRTSKALRSLGYDVNVHVGG